MKKIVLIISIISLVVSGMLSGCVYDDSLELVDYLPTLNNDLEGGNLTCNHIIEDFELITEYFTSYDTSMWRITDSKSLEMSAYISSTNATVLVEHVHIDISLKSTRQTLDGWPQDTMDDKLHVGNQPGILVTEDYPYENIFAIEGFSQTLIDGWGWFVGGYGGMSVDEDKITENDLVKYGGVYGNKVQVVYDLLLKYPDEEYFHTRCIIDEFLIPVG